MHSLATSLGDVHETNILSANKIETELKTSVPVPTYILILPLMVFNWHIFLSPTQKKNCFRLEKFKISGILQENYNLWLQ